MNICTLKDWLWIAQGPEKLSLSVGLILGQECKEWGIIDSFNYPVFLEILYTKEAKIENN